MTKKSKRFLSVVIIALLLMVGCAIEEGTQYPDAGRNQKEAFGNNRYVVFSVASPFEDDVNRYYCFYDRGREIGCLEEVLLSYLESNGTIYLLGLLGLEGKDGPIANEILRLEEKPSEFVYTKLEIENGEYVQSEDITIFSEMDREIFEELKNQETLYE